VTLAVPSSLPVANRHEVHADAARPADPERFQRTFERALREERGPDRRDERTATSGDGRDDHLDTAATRAAARPARPARPAVHKAAVRPTDHAAPTDDADATDTAGATGASDTEATTAPTDEADAGADADVDATEETTAPAAAAVAPIVVDPRVACAPALVVVQPAPGAGDVPAVDPLAPPALATVAEAASAAGAPTATPTTTPDAAAAGATAAASEGAVPSAAPTASPTDDAAPTATDDTAGPTAGAALAAAVTVAAATGAAATTTTAAAPTATDDTAVVDGPAKGRPTTGTERTRRPGTHDPAVPAAAEAPTAATALAEAAAPAVPTAAEAAADAGARPQGDSRHLDPVVATPSAATVEGARPQAAGTPEAATTAPTGHTAAAERLIEVVERLAAAAPPRHLTVELPELDGLRVQVAVRGSEVHLRVVGGQTSGDAFGSLEQDLGRALRQRGFDLAGSGGQPSGRRQPSTAGAPAQTGPTATASRARPVARPTQSGFLRI
jgi:hypothetical protein